MVDWPVPFVIDIMRTKRVVLVHPFLAGIGLGGGCAAPDFPMVAPGSPDGMDGALFPSGPGRAAMQSVRHLKSWNGQS